MFPWSHLYNLTPRDLTGDICRAWHGWISSTANSTDVTAQEQCPADRVGIITQLSVQGTGILTVPYRGFVTVTQNPGGPVHLRATNVYFDLSQNAFDTTTQWQSQVALIVPPLYTLRANVKFDGANPANTIILSWSGFQIPRGNFSF